MPAALNRMRPDRGFTATGLLCSLAVALTVTGTSLTGVTLARDLSKADTQAASVARALLHAADTARRTQHGVEVRVRNEYLVVQPVNAAEQGSVELQLGHGFVFQPLGIPHSAAAPSKAVASVATVAFDNDGHLVHDDALVNVALYLGKAGSSLSARAVVVAADGSSVVTYRWNGSRWK